MGLLSKGSALLLAPMTVLGASASGAAARDLCLEFDNSEPYFYFCPDIPSQKRRPIPKREKPPQDDPSSSPAIRGKPGEIRSLIADLRDGFASVSVTEGGDHSCQYFGTRIYSEGHIITSKSSKSGEEYLEVTIDGETVYVGRNDGLAHTGCP